MNIKHFDEINEIEQCFNVMKVLRPKLESVDDFTAQILRQQKASYRILGIEVDGIVVALAGYREMENTVHGKFIYVDDLVTLPSFRGQNFGEKLLAEVSKIAKEKGKDKVVLDTGLANNKAQKFYYRVGYLATGIHFNFDIK